MVNNKPNMKQGLLWNYASIAILSVSGLVFNALIVAFYGATALGIFNQVYAYYIVLSQVCVWGVHMSVVQCMPLLTEDEKERKAAFGSALILVIGIAGGISFITSLLIGGSTSDVAVSFSYTLPAIVIFSANKVILNYFNGISYMRIYAVLQSARSIAIAIGILFLAQRGVNEVQISLCFLFGELIVALIGVVLLICFKMLPFRVSSNWIKRHMGFGNKILLSNMVLELNTKVDIICLGWILKDDYQIGIYSFAILFAEGFYQVFVVVRRSMNPLITRTYHEYESNKESIAGLLKDAGRIIRFLRVPGLVAIVTGYYVLCHLMNKQEYLDGLWSMLIVCIFIAFTAKSIVFGNFFAQIGKPELESLINIITVATNFVGNIILISIFGVYGAAIATGISYLVFSVMLKVLLKKRVNIII